VISIPGTNAMPADVAALSASVSAAIVSWSVTLIVLMPARHARSTSVAGSQRPSDAVVWR
jgi:hypothetical protein